MGFRYAIALFINQGSDSDAPGFFGSFFLKKRTSQANACQEKKRLPSAAFFL